MPSFFESEKQLTQNTLRRLLDRFPGVAKLTSNIPESTELPQNDLPGTVSLEGGDVVNDTVAEPVGASHQSEEISRVFRNGALELTRRREIPTGSEITLDLTTPAGPIVIRGEKDRKTVELVSFWRIPGKDEQEAQAQIDDGSYEVQVDHSDGKLVVVATLPERGLVVGGDARISGNVIIGSRVIIDGIEVSRSSIQSGSIGFELKVPEGSIADGLTTGVGDINVGRINGKVIANSKSGDIKIEKTGAADLRSGRGNLSASEVQGRTRLETKSGDVDAKIIEGEMIVVSGRGGIRVSAVNGNTNLQTESGDVNASIINGSLIITTGRGDIKCDGVSNKAKLNTRSGDIEVRNAEATVEAETDRGAVVAERVKGDLRIKTGSGDISAADVIGNVICITDRGEITLTNMSGTVSAQSGSGDISLQGAKEAVVKSARGDIKADNINGDLTVSTGSGDVTIVMIGGNTTATTQRGDIYFRPVNYDLRVTAGTRRGEINLRKTSYGETERTRTTLRTDLSLNIVHSANLQTGSGDITIS